MKRLGIDLDGVTADFVKKFYQLSNSMFGTDLKGPQMNWDLDGELTKAQVGAVWDVIKRSKDFWQTLLPEEGTSSLRWARREAELIFITNRVPTAGHTVQEQSSAWLREHFFITHPYVIVAPGWESKPEFCKLLEIPTFIDDKRDTIELIHKAGLKSYARLQPYNSRDPFPEGVVPVENLNEFLEVELG